MSSRLRSRPFFEARVLPWLLPAPALAVVFGLVLYPLGRTLWLSFRQAGLPYLATGHRPTAWGVLGLHDPPRPFRAGGLVVVWPSFPFPALSPLAGAPWIPPEVREAARMAGAGPWHQPRHVTLPMLRPLLLALVVISTI